MRNDMSGDVILVTGGAGFIGSAVVRHLVGDFFDAAGVEHGYIATM